MYETILVPLDVQHNSSWETAMPVAVRLVRAFDAELTVMTVVPEFVAGVDWRYAIRGETGGSEAYDLKAMLRQAKDRLGEICATALPSELAPSLVVRHGKPFEQILETAADIDAGLIVMAALRPSLKEYLLGSTTARVVRHADCSVHVVRPTDGPL